MIVFVVILRHAYNKNNHLGEENLNHVMDGWMRGGNQILYVIDIYIYIYALGTSSEISKVLCIM